MANGLDIENRPTTEQVFTSDTGNGKTLMDEDDHDNQLKRPKLEDKTKSNNALPSPAAEPPSMSTSGNKDSSSPHTAKVRKQSVRTASPSPIIPTGHTHMTRDQLKYCGAIMKNLKKHRDAAPFLHPVDYMKLNVPDYPKIIRNPMDLNTIDRKLNSCQYDFVDDFVADVRLVFNNCYKFNGPEAMISMLCQNVESAFEKSLRQMPPSKEPSPPLSNSPASIEDKSKYMDDRPIVGKKKTMKAMSPPPAIRRISEDGRPKREIHPPPSKDYPEPMTKRRNPRKNDLQMKFCAQALREMKKSKYRDINYPFLAPVDIVALNIPDYPNIVKHPMDLSTIERKLNEGDYDTPEEFEVDVRLMFSNCYLYNPPVTPVHKMGKELEKVFADKWKQKPQPAPREPERGHDDFDEEIESEEDDRDQRIAELERHIATISQQIASIKSSKKRKVDRLPGKSRPSRPISKDKKPTEKRKRPVLKRKEEELPDFTFEQKKDLSERINNLTGDRLNTVVSIIQSSMPNLDGQGQEEIVLDIDALDRRTLHRLHEFVTGKSLVPHKRSPAPKRPRTHYSEEDADRKIQELEKTLQKFNERSGSQSYYDNARGNASSSDSESDSSSGSESDDSGNSSSD
ncbi:hypothetical protein DFQ28_010784 [Apophysomyces sp. BC1034]|nr:hypothetical protein DFQ28_010784 [Apophysomyces sp. BC1034]